MDVGALQRRVDVGRHRGRGAGRLYPPDGDIGSYLRATALYTDGDGSGKTAQGATAGVVVDATPPTVKTVDIISAPGSSGAYLSDEDIEVAVTFSEPVRVGGKPRLRLTIGGAQPYATVRFAGAA
ncbi:MAG: hypothetical protein OXE02_06770 [Chloroflexi bacterium]|nr:hypothetical protein [Chloroflexota bacterium]